MAPAEFETTQLYSPAWPALTDSMDNCLDLFPDFKTVTSSLSGLIAVPLNIQTISKGRSPFMTVQVNDVISPAFAGSSPKENGLI